VFELFRELQRYVGFTERDEVVLRALPVEVHQHFPEIAELFYARVLEFEPARAALTRGEKHVGQLKGTLVRWMKELVTGPWDEAYVARRARIGRVHVEIALPQHYMVSAMNIIRVHLRERVGRILGEGTSALKEAEASLERICDIDLALMLHTYREDLEASQARAERLSTFGQLVGSIGHELRNPLGVIETSLFVLKGRPTEDEKVKRHLDRISTQVSLANDIITQLLSLIRERPLDRAPVKLPALIREAMLETPAVVLSLAEDVVVTGDATQLRQVLVNLTQNATWFATDQGRVEVSLQREGDRAVLFVDDSGPGIDPSVRNRLFEPLVTTRPGGIGLGLALVKRIIERHGGTVGASRSPLGGARFEVRLPIRGDG
jgi:signal transduction histidine kinase